MAKEGEGRVAEERGRLGLHTAQAQLSPPPPTSSPPGLQPPEDQPHSWNRSPSPPGRLIPRGHAEAFAPPLPHPRVLAPRPSPPQAAPSHKMSPSRISHSRRGLTETGGQCQGRRLLFTLNVSQGLPRRAPSRKSTLVEVIPTAVPK